MAEGGTRPTHILIMGKTGSGKSATGNSILMENMFHSSSGGDAVTSKSEAAGNEVIDRQVIVVDTPGTMDTSDPNKALNDIANSVCQLDNRIDVFIIVMKVAARITEEDMISWKKLKNLLGKEILKHAIIVFTEGDNYEKQRRRKKDTRDFETYLRETSGAKLLEIIEDCGWRYVLFYNFADTAGKTVQVHELFQKIDQLKRKNGGQMYRTKYPARNRNFDENNFDIANLFDPDLGDINLTFESMKEETKNWNKEPGEEKEECFPADALVTLSSGLEVKMENLKVGDQVLTVSDNLGVCQTEVYLFGHALKDCKATFVCLQTATRLLKVTNGHYVYTFTNKEFTPKPAKDVIKGDILLTLKEGRCVLEEVRDIWWSEERGLYAPFTMSGSVIVGGVLASCYVDMMSAEIAHSLLWPVRKIYKMSPGMLRVVSKSGDTESEYPLRKICLTPWVK